MSTLQRTWCHLSIPVGVTRRNRRNQEDTKDEEEMRYQLSDDMDMVVHDNGRITFTEPGSEDYRGEMFAIDAYSAENMVKILKDNPYPPER